MTMDFGKTTKIESVALTADLPDLLYPVNDQDEQENVHKVILRDVVRFLGPKIGIFPMGYNLIVLKEAMDAFINYADDVYNKSRKEATGLHLGYYLHAPEDPDIKVGIATTFMEASGDASVVTCEICKCEFSYEDEDILWGDQRDPYKEVECPCCKNRHHGDCLSDHIGNTQSNIMLCGNIRKVSEIRSCQVNINSWKQGIVGDILDMEVDVVKISAFTQFFNVFNGIHS